MQTLLTEAAVGSASPSPSRGEEESEEVVCSAGECGESFVLAVWQRLQLGAVKEMRCVVHISFHLIVVSVKLESVWASW